MAENSTDSLYLNKLKFDQGMLKSPIAWLITNIRVVFLAIIALVIAGGYSYATLPRELNPEVSIPLVIVSTAYPGANPLDVEKLVTKKLETELDNVTDLDTMESQSLDSYSVITLQFISSADPDKALQAVKDKVDLVTDLPADAEPPKVSKLDFNDQPILTMALTGAADRYSLSVVAQELQDILESNPAIRKVELSGAEEEELAVAIKPQSLAQYQLSADQLISTITTSDITFPAGTITLNETEYQLSVDQDLPNISALRQLPISIGSTQAPLGELADVYLRTKSSNVRATYATPNSAAQPAIQLNIYKSPTATITQTSSIAQQLVADKIQSYPQLRALVIVDTAQLIEESFASLGSNFMQTILLVFAVLFIFLGLKQASVAAISIPLTFLSAFVIMNLTGITLNFLSLFSLLLAMGLVVDDAIVIVESSARYSKKFSPFETGLMVYRDFVVPIWTTTITTVWAFLPLVLATGIIGEFIKSIPIVVSATLISSTTVAVLINLPLTVTLAKMQLPRRVRLLFGLLLTLTTSVLIWRMGTGPLQLPLLALWFVLLGLIWWSRQQLLTTTQLILSWFSARLTASQIPISTSFMSANTIRYGLIDLTSVRQKYYQLLVNLLTNKRRRWQLYGAISVFFVISVVVFPAAGLLKNEFFPKSDEDQLYVNVEGATGWTVDKTEQILSAVEEIVLKEAGVESVLSQTGGLAPVDFAGPGSGAHLGYLTVKLMPDDQRPLTSIAIADNLRADFSSFSAAKVTIAEVSGGPPAGADLEINILGPELDQLEKISQDFTQILNELEVPKSGETKPAAINISTSLAQTPGQIAIALNETELRERGLSAIQVGSWLRTAVTGTTASEISLAGNDLDITLTIAQDNQSLDKLKNIPLPAAFGQYTLAEVADFELTTSPSVIYHQDGQRKVTVSAAANQIPAPELLKLFQTAAADYQLPSGYTWTTGGVNQENQESTQSIIQAMGLSAILILITMVIQLNSFRQSGLVLAVIPLAVAGVFFNFTILGIPLSFPALIGVLALFGIVVNNSIMLIEKINQNLKLGLPFVEGVADACSSRVEAILFTSLTTTLGLLPITISDPLWRGLGGSIIAGLSVSGLLILFLLPALYVEVMKSSD